ncbi:MAG: tight adherence protein B [Pirellulaceae bacterium]|jgi:tight adherence protein B
MSIATIIVGISIFLFVMCAIGALAMQMAPTASSAAEDRLSILTRQTDETAGGTGSVLSQPLFDEISSVEKFASRFLNVKTFLEQAEAPFSPTLFCYITGGMFVLGLFIPLVAPVSIFFGPLIALALSVLPFFAMSFKRKRRLAKFGQQLPDALELLARALRAGHSLAAGINLAATEMADPLGKEFTRCFEEQNLGIPLEDSLETMTERVPNLDLRFFATAVILQRQTGGDLAEILDKIGHLIRERFKIWGQVQALTGEGRLSGIVLLSLPPVLFGVMYRLNPKYVSTLFTDEMGQQMLVFAIVMQFVGALVIRQIVNIKV